MSGTSKSKLKLLYILKILNELSDEENPLTVNDIIDELAKYEITAERKSIYSDLSLLEEFGVDICKCQSKIHGYFVGSREFELPEIKLLVDEVQASKFISKKKTIELIKKLKNQTSKNQAKLINEQVFTDDRIKCINEEIYYNIDKLCTAINISKKVQFQYYDYDLNKNRVLKNTGMYYLVSPYGLSWFDDNYYLIGNYDKYENLSHYRVDRICNIMIMDSPRIDFKLLSSYKNYFNIADYIKKTYNMFSGTNEVIEIRFKNNVINSILDKFGTDITIIREENNYFKIRVEANISDGFISWLFTFGGDAEVVSPQSLREKIKEKINSIQNLYK